MRALFSWLFGTNNATAPACRAPRLELEVLESRTVPSIGSRVGAGGHAAPPPYADTPWAPLNNRHFVAAQSTTLLQAMYFNNPVSYDLYHQHFQGVLASWVANADRHHIAKTDALTSYLHRQLNREFEATQGALARLYPGQSMQTYQLLVAMNLVTGYYEYGTVPIKQRSLYAQLHLQVGDCAQIAQLLESIIHIEGIPALQLAQYYKFTTPLGSFVSSHDVVYAGGLWLDAEINTAFALDLKHFVKTAPYHRLSSLLNHHEVFGFYNWYLQPPVRAAQLEHGLDGGILSFYYQYYFAGIGQGETALYFQN
jgi:hypothetical protein